MPRAIANARPASATAVSQITGWTQWVSSSPSVRRRLPWARPGTSDRGVERLVDQRLLTSPDETRKFPLGQVEVVRLGERSVGCLTLQPGFRWSDHVRPIAKTELCQERHMGYHVSGRFHVRMGDGREFEIGAGEVACIQPGHDAWVVGSVPVVMIDWEAAEGFARPGT